MAALSPMLNAQYIIGTFAGGGIPNGVPATSIGFGPPTSVVKDTSGNVYFSSDVQHHVYKVDMSGKLTVVAGNGGFGCSADGASAIGVPLGGITAIALDSAGSLYIGDSYCGNVRKVVNGAITTVASGIGNALGIAIDGARNLFIATGSFNSIFKVANGVVSTIAGNGSPGYSGDGGSATAVMLNYPAGVALDGSGSLYIADLFNNRIRKITNGIITTFAGNGSSLLSAGDGGPATAAAVGSPRGVALDSSGNLYIAQADYVRRVTNGLISTIAGSGDVNFSGDGGSAIFAGMNPSALFVDSGGVLFIADSFNNRIRTVSLGIIATIAGDGSYGYYGEGIPATLATLSQAYGIALDSSGNLFIQDTPNGRIRKVANGQISTVIVGIQPHLSSGLTVDSAGQIYFVDGSFVRKYSNGFVTTVAGSGEVDIPETEGRLPTRISRPTVSPWIAKGAFTSRIDLITGFERLPRG